MIRHYAGWLAGAGVFAGISIGSGRWAFLFPAVACLAGAVGKALVLRKEAEDERQGR